MEKKQLSKKQIEEIFAGTSIASAGILPVIFADLASNKVVDDHVVRDACAKFDITLSGKEIQSVVTRYEVIKR